MKKWLCLLLCGVLLLPAGCKGASLKLVTQTDIAVDPMHLGDVREGYACVVPLSGDGSSFAFVDTAGNYLSETTYDMAYDFGEDKRALVLMDKDYVYINTEGAVVEQATQPTKTESDYSLFYEKDGKIGLMDADKQPLTEAIFDYISSFSAEGYASAQYESDGATKSCLINRQGKQIPLPDTSSRAFVDGQYIHCTMTEDGNRQDTLLDMTGKEILTRRYDLVNNCDNQFFAVIQDGKLGLLNTDGSELVAPSIPCDYSPDMRIGYGEGYLTISVSGCLAFVKISV